MSSTGTRIRPPPVYHDAISDGYKAFITVAAIFTALSISSVALRFVQRRMIRQISWDDWAILASLLFVAGVMVTAVLVATEGGGGYHIWTFETPQLEEYIKICLANNVIYNTSPMFSKLSVMLFYRCIFSIGPKTKRFMQVVAFVVIGNCASAAGGLIFSNSPVEGQWDLSIPSTTIKTKTFWFSIGVINLVLDVVILLVPQVSVWKLHCR